MTANPPTDRDLWEMGMLTRAQLAHWTDDDLRSHVAGLRKTLKYLFERMDAISHDGEQSV